MNQTVYMVTSGMLKFLDEKPYSHQKITILGKDASFNIDNNSAD